MRYSIETLDIIVIGSRTPAPVFLVANSIDSIEVSDPKSDAGRVEAPDAPMKRP